MSSHTLESCANKVNLKQLHKSTCTELGLHANNWQKHEREKKSVPL